MSFENYSLHNPYLIKNKTTVAIPIEKFVIKFGKNN